MKKEQITELLMLKEGLQREQLELAAEEKHKTGAPLGYLVIKFGLLTLEQWYNFVLKELKYATIDLAQIEIDRNVVISIPEFTCRKYRVVPVYKGGNKLICGMVDPTDEEVVAELEKITSLKIEPRLAKERDVKESIEKYFTHGNLDIIAPSFTKRIDGKANKSSGITEISDSSAVQAVEGIISRAVELKATDIHIEIEEDRTKLRYRINGLLYEVPSPPLELYPAIVSHIKVSSLLDISEKRIPQDGYLKVKVSGKDVDLRVSSYPTIFGEMVAMRILDKRNIISGLEHLGFLPQTLHRWRMLLDEPYGILLVTGPTGSGKTTVLYSSLNELDKEHRKIMTVEDPVEYHLENIDQTQISPKAGLTFGVALRSILRQDPDVVMIGEIRDLETAEICIKAALTGHLVFSTLHTNDAPGSVDRLRNMGVEPFMLAASLTLIVAQRLARRICPRCKEEYQPEPEILKELAIPEGQQGAAPTFSRGKGCEYCNGTGYRGRVALYEIMEINDAIKKSILQGCSGGALKDLARAQGMKTLRESGIRKILDGLTTIEEVLRVTRAD